MKLRKVGLFLLLLCMSGQLFSQTYLKRSEMSVPNPTTAEITKVGLTPVNQYTGKADISIPLYSMDFDGMQIPLNLSYDSGGIKVDQEATWAGLGWSLSGIPTIMHVINQKSDIGRRKPDEEPLYAGYCTEPEVPSEMTTAYLTQLNQGYPHSNVINDTYDTQPDVFVASLHGATIKFQLTQAATTGTIQAIILNDSNAKITYYPNNRHFDIVDEAGYKYEFRHTEYSSNFSMDLGIGGYDPDPQHIYGDGTGFLFERDKEIPTAWYVDKIISPRGKELEYNYYGDTEGASYYHLSHPRYFETLSRFVCGTDYNNGNVGNYLPPILSTRNVIRSVQEVKILKEITNKSNGERIVFKTDFRNDLWPYDNINFGLYTPYNGGPNVNQEDRLKLTGIEAFASSGKMVKNIQLHQSYFNSDRASEPHPQTFIRLKLDGLSVDGQNYTFDYEQPNALPEKHSMDVDFWGFYNGAENNVRYPSLEFNSSFCFYSNPEYEAEGDLVGGKLGSKFDKGKIGTLNQITFPTGGYTIFDYESNTARISLDSDSPVYDEQSYYYLMNNNLEPGYPLSSSVDPNLKTFKIGGLRVRTVTNFDQNGEQLLKKEYEYENLENSSIPMSNGILMNKLLYFSLTDAAYESGNVLITTINNTNSNKYNTKNSAMGSHVGYDKVEEFVKSNESTSLTNGKTVTTFINERNRTIDGAYTGIVGIAADAPPIHFEDANGRIIRQDIFDLTGNLKSSLENTYELVDQEVAPGYKVYYASITNEILGVPAFSNPVYEFFKYEAKKYFPLLTESKKTEYFEDQPAYEQVTFTGYNSKHRIRSTEANTSLSGLSKKRVEFYYPYDTDYGVNGYVHMNGLAEANRINEPVYVRKFNNGQFIGHEFSPYYHYFSGNVYKKSINYQKQDAPLADIDERLVYGGYDENGNITEVHLPGGASTQFLWGDERKYPVAKIENVPPDAAPLSEVVDETLLQNSKANDEEVAAEINNIRTHPDYEGAHVTGYSFDAGVGLSQSIDPRSYGMNYEFDDQERLILVKDNDENLLAETEYNLINESSDCLDCAVIELTTSAYKLFATQNVTISINMPSGTGTITRWEMEMGDGTRQEGTGSPPASLNYEYTELGLKIIRLAAYTSNSEFVTGQVNVRVAEGSIPGSDIYFGNIVSVASNEKTAKLYGDPGSVITYAVRIGGGSTDHSGTATVNGVTTNVSGFTPVFKTVTIPSSGYVNCSVKHNGSPQGGTGSTLITLEEATIGNIASPSTLSVSCCFGGY